MIQKSVDRDSSQPRVKRGINETIRAPDKLLAKLPVRDLPRPERCGNSARQAGGCARVAFSEPAKGVDVFCLGAFD